MDKRHTTIQGTWAYSAPQLKQNGVLVVGAQISLRREPSNPHDRNAAAVLLGTSQIGYLPRALAAELSPYLDSGGHYSGEVTHVGTHTYKGRTHPTVYIDLVLTNLSPQAGLEALLHAASLMKGESGVYRIYNTVDKKSYIGSSSDVGKRLHEHITELRNGTHPNYRLSEGWRRDGPSAFEVSLVERVSGPGLREREKFHIQRLESHRHGYNQTADGEGATPLTAAERSKLGLDLLPRKPVERLPQPSLAAPSSLSSSSAKPPQGCLILVLVIFGIVTDIWCVLSRQEPKGEKVGRGPLAAATRAERTASSETKAQNPQILTNHGTNPKKSGTGDITAQRLNRALFHSATLFQ